MDHFTSMLKVVVVRDLATFKRKNSILRTSDPSHPFHLRFLEYLFFRENSSAEQWESQSCYWRSRLIALDQKNFAVRWKRSTDVAARFKTSQRNSIQVLINIYMDENRNESCSDCGHQVNHSRVGLRNPLIFSKQGDEVTLNKQMVFHFK